MRRERYEQIVNLYASGLSQHSIAEKMGFHRSTVQRYLWLHSLPDYVKDSFFEQRLAESSIHNLYKLREDPDGLLAAWREEKCETLELTRTPGEIRLALEKVVGEKRIALLWVLGERDTL